jgi:hypothetical protein
LHFFFSNIFYISLTFNKRDNKMTNDEIKMLLASRLEKKAGSLADIQHDSYLNLPIIGATITPVLYELITRARGKKPNWYGRIGSVLGGAAGGLVLDEVVDNANQRNEALRDIKFNLSVGPSKYEVSDAGRRIASALYSLAENVKQK